ncbi:hypothetical protein BDEG_20983 [Batrachochytrium dendrobatidis JEL423]|uniref:Uncharacterized protein n=1 Tax=Batrachochytrium dendrobatidis (strain JEL423) TaxID=403673 RepID=A0A177WBX3_BATDL|nr:hypothetical protein BDEG_20983 [Batrachochytrium dendrobatidis JEL423]
MVQENARVPRSFLDVAYKKIAALTYFRLALICYFLCEVALRLMSILISPSIVLLGQVSSQFIFIMILCIIFRMQKPIVAYLSTRMDGRVIVTVDPLQNTQPNARSSSTPLTVNTIGVSALNQAGVLIQVYPIQIRSTDNIPISSTSSLFNPNATNSYGTGENSESRQSRQQASHLLFNGVVHGFNFVVVPPYSRINIGTERPKMELATLVKQSIRPT